MHKAKSVVTLLGQQIKLSNQQSSKIEDKEEKMSKVPYANVVGSIMYNMVCSRPDLAYAISVVSMFMSNPGEKHLEALKWILRYIRDTTCNGLLFTGKPTDSDSLIGYMTLL